MRGFGGFSLIELLVVLAIISLLAMMVVPSTLSVSARDEVDESLRLVEKLKPAVETFRSGAQRMPVSNEEAGLPAADKLLGNYVTSIELKDGAFHLTFGNKAMAGLRGKLLSVRPVEVADSPASPVSWICGHSPVPGGMQADGEDRTTVPPALLPIACRNLAPATH